MSSEINYLSDFSYLECYMLQLNFEMQFSIKIKSISLIKKFRYLLDCEIITSRIFNPFQEN